MIRLNCRLCGGRLQSMKCVECGLDNTDYENYERHKKVQINAGEGDREKRRALLTHIHEDKEERKEQENNKQEHNKQENSKKESNRQVYTLPKTIPQTIQANKSKPKKTNASLLKKVIGIILIFAVLRGGFPAMMGFFRYVYNIYEESHGEVEIVIEKEIDLEDGQYDVYTRSTREAFTEGESCEMILTQGNYIVGMHIPEGTYTAEFIEGGGIVVSIDPQNQIYIQDFFSDEADDGIVKIENWRLYNGAIIDIPNKVTVAFSTDTAQPLSEIPIENPLTEVVALTEQGIAGIDFPAGIYDISTNEEHVYVNIFIKGDEEGTLDYWYTLSEDESMATYVVLPEGSLIITFPEDSSITLTPTAEIKDTEYTQFHDTYY